MEDKIDIMRVEDDTNPCLDQENTSQKELEVTDFDQNTSNEHEEVETPKIGMVFNSDNEAYDYYKRYGYFQGFGVIKKTRKLDDGNRLKYVTYSCAKVGSWKCISSKRRRSSAKTGCKASVNMVVAADGHYTISSVKLEHNHALSPPRAMVSKCNKELNWQANTSVGSNGQAGFPLTKTSYNSLVVEAEGCGNLDIGEIEYQNYVKKLRQSRLGVGDAKAVYTYFVQNKKNSRFFYKMEFDDENRLRNAFWADARSRAAYESFRDVITIDTTYLTDRYSMPLVAFVGTNNHGQLLLFGCGVLSGEDAESYVWLFESWLECMKGCAPSAIITEESKAIKEAVTEVFPKARHRFCLWHIMRQIPVKLNGLVDYKLISSSLMDTVYDSWTQLDFEAGWPKMIEANNLNNNKWLNSLYVDRHLWVPAFVKDTFWAGMSTSKRDECANSFFDGYVNPNTTLKQFVKQYDIALRSKIEKENSATLASLSSRVSLTTNFRIERQLQEVYSIEMFKKFQDELRGLYYCNVGFVKAEGSVSTFHVRENVKLRDENSRKLKIYEVIYNVTDCEAQCVCHLFESDGILCRHVIAVLTDQCVEEIPSKYIIDRWRKDLKLKYTCIGRSDEWYDELHRKTDELIEIAMDSFEKRPTLSRILDEAKEKLLVEDPECNTQQHGNLQAESNLRKRLSSSSKVSTKVHPHRKENS